MELKKIDFAKDHFMANGTKYLIKDTLTVERFIAYEKIQNHYAFGLSFPQIYARLTDAIEFANKGKGVDAWNVIFNLRDGVGSRIEDRTHPALLLCSLFVVTENEDLTVWDEKAQGKKFEDWNKEAIDIQSFFTLASNFVPNFIRILNEISQNTFQRDKVVGQKYTKNK